MEQRKIHTSVYTSKLCLPLYLTINISICLSTLLNNNHFYTDNLTISWVLLPFPSPHQVKSHIRGKMKSTKQCSISDHFLYFLIKTLKSINRLSRSKQLNSLLSIYWTSKISHKLPWLRSRPKVYPYQVWPSSEKNCTRESGNGDVSTNRRMNRLTIWFQYSPLSTLLSGCMKIIQHVENWIALNGVFIPPPFFNHLCHEMKQCN